MTRVGEDLRTDLVTRRCESRGRVSCILAASLIGSTATPAVSSPACRLLKYLVRVLHCLTSNVMFSSDIGLAMVFAVDLVTAAI